MDALEERAREELNRAWHRLDPWPDSVSGLTRLKRRYILATLSNGNVALLVNMAKRAVCLGMPCWVPRWRVITSHNPKPTGSRRACWGCPRSSV